MSSAFRKNVSQLWTVIQVALLGAVAATGCVSSSKDNTGAGGAGGTPAADAAALPIAAACLPITAPLITDFAYTAGTTTKQASFGDYKTTFSGGTYIYPDPGLTSDVSGGNWHISGPVATYSGFGLYLNVSSGAACALFDASAYKGISMTISGSVPASVSLFLNVGTVEDTVSTAWFAKNQPAPTTPTFGTCNPAPTNQYDGTCLAPSASIPVTATPTPVRILWTDLTAGKPQASVTTSQLTSLAFSFNWTSGSFPVDVTVDDLSFIP